MKAPVGKPAAALDGLPEEMRESAVAYLIEQAEKFRALQDRVADGRGDPQAGRESELKFREFLRDTRPKCVGRD